ncbi:MAG: hypothetical protein WAM27_10915, partial [Nitrososphaeraceae archaeon]
SNAITNSPDVITGRYSSKLTMVKNRDQHTKVFVTFKILIIISNPMILYYCIRLRQILQTYSREVLMLPFSFTILMFR